jgi:hypothetical protein
MPDMSATVAYSRARHRPGPGSAPKIKPRHRRDIMLPMFTELFIDTDTDAMAAEDEWRRRGRRSRRARPGMITRPATRHRETRPRP